MNIYMLFILAFAYLWCYQSFRGNEAVSNGRRRGLVVSFLKTEVPIDSVVDIITGANDGRKQRNFGGGNQGAYYNFMYPDDTDYPWACTCNMEDYAKWRKKELPYVRCRNQEDLSQQDIQANCDPTNVTVRENTDGAWIYEKLS